MATVNKKARIASVQQMVEAMIQGDQDTASTAFKTYMQIASREILLGEGSDDDSDESEETEMTDDDNDETVNDTSDDDTDGEESDDEGDDGEESDDEGDSESNDDDEVDIKMVKSDK